jgi:dTDP-4-dehydrorhamnose reductase
MRILLIGSAGQLGCDIATTLAGRHELVCPDHDAAPVENEERITQFVTAHRPDLVVNAAAFHDVEKCEADPARAFAVNTLGPLHIARAADKVHASFYHFSTDYVFSGAQQRPYEECDWPAPCNVYGHSKLAGERLALATRAGGYVLRVGALYGAAPCRGKGGRNFLRTMIEFCARGAEIAVTNDELITPTCTQDIARQLAHMIESSAPPGLYHATCQGDCSWFGFAREIFACLDVRARLRPAREGEFPVKTPRPQMSVLSNAALKRTGLDIMPPWRDALGAFVSANRTLIAGWHTTVETAVTT